MVMDHNELFAKYQRLLAENITLKEENIALKARLGLNQKSESDQGQISASNSPLELVSQESPSETPDQKRIEQGVTTTNTGGKLPIRISSLSLRTLMKISCS
ncbi:MAG: hypothetical protein CVU52_01580 [Deltaproteobacteria bacterium HGW-Deltaproteobacteria-10]|nr:MAG: hypothetical protein CVU52_01580 [Deltaproteobacteria bacterium HGW-Deltaproteobacteria-10]